MARGGIVDTSIKTSDGAAKTSAGIVYWMTVGAAATGGAFQLNDSTDDTGTDLVSGVVAANSGYFMYFDPPVHFATGIFVDIPGSNITITVGYS